MLIFRVIVKPLERQGVSLRTVVPLLQQDNAAVRIGHCFADRLCTLPVFFPIAPIAGQVQFKLCAGHRFVVLIDLVNIRFRDGHQVVPQGHVGVAGATFQIEEIKSVVGLIRKGPRGLIAPNRPVFCISGHVQFTKCLPIR